MSGLSPSLALWQWTPSKKLAMDIPVPQCPLRRLPTPYFKDFSVMTPVIQDGLRVIVSFSPVATLH
jgi:hypothetical protein